MSITVGKRLWSDDGRPSSPPDPRLRGDSIPAWARAKLGPTDIVFAGPGESVLAFAPVDAWTATPRLVSASRVQELDLPPIPAPFRHAFDDAGEQLFLARANHVVRVDLETGLSAPVSSCTGLVQLFGPPRIAWAGAWLGVTSSERLTFVRFEHGEIAETVWYTCRYGESMTALLGGRMLLAGARAGGALFAVDGDRIERVASLDAADIFPNWRGTGITAAWMDGETVCVQASECSEFDGRIEHSTTYALHGLPSAWTSTYGPVTPLDEGARIAAAAAGQVYVSESAKPPTHPMPHPDVSSLSYPEAGPTGYGFGFERSDRAGYWNTHVVTAKRIRPLSPPWYSGVTYHDFHETEPRLLLGSGEELIEAELRERTWTGHPAPASLRGVAYFGGFAAILTPEQLRLYDLAGRQTIAEHPIASGDDSELVSLHGGRVLLVPRKDGCGLFLGLRDQQLVVLGVIEGQSWTAGWSIGGRSFLKRRQPGYLEVHNLEAALQAAPDVREELDLLTDPSVIVAVAEQPPAPVVVVDELIDADRLARIRAVVLAATRGQSLSEGEGEDAIEVSFDVGEFEVDGPRQVSFVVHVNVDRCPEWNQESAVSLAESGLSELLRAAHVTLRDEGQDCGLRVRDKQTYW